MCFRTKKILMEIQLRGQTIEFVSDFTTAFTKVTTDPTIWKVSFTYPTINGDRYRLVKQEDGSWKNRPLRCLDKPPYCDESEKLIPLLLHSELVDAGFLLNQLPACICP
jgi:hypothetical protein